MNISSDRTSLPPTSGKSLWLTCIFGLCVAGGSAWAEPSPLTSSGLNTQVSNPISIEGTTHYDITGGTRPENGPNLFHSFGKFSVPSDTIVNFLNETALPTTNILARVTGGQSSNILGTLQTTGFGAANLFLMNPSGIVFGPSASLNVGGSVVLTTADYLRLNGQALFNAIPNAEADALLSTAPISAYGFLGAHPNSILIQGGQLSVQEGQSISLVAGSQGFSYSDPITGTTDSTPHSLTLEEGTLSAPAGQIYLASVASLGEISAATLMPPPEMSMGNISLSQGTRLDVSADAAGTVRIRGGQLTIDQATILADTHTGDGSPTAIDIHVTGDISLANDSGPALAARTTGMGHAGTIHIQSENLTASTSTTDGLVALIDTHTSGTGTAGNIELLTSNLLATNTGFFIDTGTSETGHGGNVSIQGRDITIENTQVATGNLRGLAQGLDVSGSAGNLTIKASDTLQIGPSAVLSTDAWFAEPGRIELQGRDISIIGNSFVTIDGDFGGAGITVTANHLRLDFSSVLSSNTVVDHGGPITINAREISLTNGSRIQTSTLGDGEAGDILIMASERLTLDGRDKESSLPTAIVSNFFAYDLAPFGSGGSGSITVVTSDLNILGGALINTSTNHSGDAGNISIAAHSVTISGQSQILIPHSELEIGSTSGSGIYTRTVGTIGSDLCPMSCGNAGNISVTADSLKLSDGGTINSGTTNNGFGGNIILTADQSVTIQSGASISAQSLGSGNAGDIRIDAGRQLTVKNGSITTEAGQASGGNIDIRATDLVRLTDNGRISTSVLGGTGSGGNITIDPDAVILQNGHILAQAARGNGGNITITTPVFLADQLSLVSASSQFGLDGTITIQSPISNLSGTVGRLASKTSPPQSLLQNRCVALAGGEHSSFVITGRDAVPTEPGGWLSSPILAPSMRSAARNGGEPTADMATGSPKQSASQVALLYGVESAPLSLRHLTPPGFLVRHFAGDGSTGCRS